MTEKRNSLNIIMIVYELIENYEQIATRVKEKTKYPHNLVVGLNKGYNHNEAILLMKRLLNEGKIDKLYVFDENYICNATQYIFEKEKHENDFVVISDGDCLLPQEMPFCWLETFTSFLMRNEQVGSVGFEPLLYSWQMQDLRKIYFVGKDAIAWKNRVRRKGRMIEDGFIIKPTQGMFYTTKVEYVKDFYEITAYTLTDGRFDTFLNHRKKLICCRYNKYLVENLSWKSYFQNKKYFQKRRNNPHPFKRERINMSDIKCVIYEN